MPHDTEQLLAESGFPAHRRCQHRQRADNHPLQTGWTSRARGRSPASKPLWQTDAGVNDQWRQRDRILLGDSELGHFRYRDRYGYRNRDRMANSKVDTDSDPDSDTD